MLTKNFYSYAMAMGTNTTIVNGYVDYEGTTQDACPAADVVPFSAMYNLTAENSETTYGVMIGSGSTPAAVDDYHLEAPITDGFGVVKPQNGAISSEEACVKWSATYAITNTGAEPLTIREIGLFGRCGISLSLVKRALYDRTVLERPIVIEPGHSKQVTYTIWLNYPTD